MFATARNFGTKNATVTIQRWLNEARQGGDRNGYLGHRRHPRFGWDAPITLELMDGKEVIETFYGTARDMSVGGMGLRCRREMASGTEVRITLDRTGDSVRATVRYCAESVTNFNVGVAFKSGSAGPLRMSA